MFDVFISVITAFTITYFAIPAIITVAERKKLFDVPDERKIHQLPIPSLGGLGIFAGMLISCMVFVPLNVSPELQYFFAASIVIFFLGIKDDILIISPIKKFIGQVLAAFLIIYFGGLQITSMQGVLNIYELSEMFSLMLSYFTILVIINSFNLIDGIDGLAASLGILVTILCGIFFIQTNETAYAILAFSTAGSILAFLIFNFYPAKIFMGDTGSLLIGLVSSMLVIKLLEVSGTPASPIPASGAPAIAISLLMIPLMDTLRVFSIRIINRRSPFSPDRNHLHHILLDRGLTHPQITISLVAVNLVVVSLVYLFSKMNVNSTLLILGIVAMYFTATGILYFTRKTSRWFVAPVQETEASKAKKSKIVPLTKDSVLEEKN